MQSVDDAVQVLTSRWSMGIYIVDRVVYADKGNGIVICPAIRTN